MHVLCKIRFIDIILRETPLNNRSCKTSHKSLGNIKVEKFFKIIPLRYKKEDPFLPMY